MSVLFGVLIEWLGTLFTKTFLHSAFKIAITLAFIALVVASIYAYVSAASAIITSLSQTVPEIVAGVWGWVMPSNTSACLVAMTSSVLLRFFTAQFKAILNYKFKAAISN